MVMPTPAATAMAAVTNADACARSHAANMSADTYTTSSGIGAHAYTTHMYPGSNILVLTRRWP